MSTTAPANETAKLSSLFNKKKKKSTLNANAMVKEAAPPAAPVAAPTGAKSPVRKPVKSPRSASTSPSKKPAARPSTGVQSTVKTLSDLSLEDKKEEPAKAAFQWSKQPKKYKNTTSKESVAKTWEEQEERNRLARRLNLESERAFPTLGTDAETAKLQGMKTAKTKSVATKNVWSTLNAAEEDEDSD